MGFRAPVSQDSNTPTRTVASSPSPGTYAAPSLLTPWGRNTWAHMSADVFIFFYTKRGNMFHNKCLHTLEQNFFFFWEKERKWDSERQKLLWVKQVEGLFLWNVFITQLEKSLPVCWERSVLRFGFLGSEQGRSFLVEIGGKQSID